MAPVPLAGDARRPIVEVDGAGLFLARVDASPEAVLRARAAVLPEEAARADRIVHPRARAVSLAGRAFLRAVLAAATGRPPLGIPIVADGNGKPFVPPAAGLRSPHFNLSHSGDLVLVALARDGPVGVDVEEHRAMDDLDRVAGAVLTPDELGRLLGIAGRGRLTAFLDLWCAKEAVMKADGRGFRIDPRSIRLSALPGPATATVLAEVAGSAVRWRVTRIALDGAAAAVACPHAP